MKGQSSNKNENESRASCILQEIWGDKRNCGKISTFDKMNEDYYKYEYDEVFMSMIFRFYSQIKSIKNKEKNYLYTLKYI